MIARKDHLLANARATKVKPLTTLVGSVVLLGSHYGSAKQFFAGQRLFHFQLGFLLG